MAERLAEIADTFFKPALQDVVPYEPGKPIEEVQRELGLERVVKLASNEGPFGPFPEALEAIASAAPELNRYPDGGAADQAEAGCRERLLTGSGKSDGHGGCVLHDAEHAPCRVVLEIAGQVVRVALLRRQWALWMLPEE